MRGYFRLTHAGTCVLPARAEAPPPPQPGALNAPDLQTSNNPPLGFPKEATGHHQLGRHRTTVFICSSGPLSSSGSGVLEPETGPAALPCLGQVPLLPWLLWGPHTALCASTCSLPAQGLLGFLSCPTVFLPRGSQPFQ